jgi:tetratricopeptide (TPR) repeat protein
MTLDRFLKQAWNDHATQSEQVASRLSEAISLVEKNDQIPSLAHLITHVLGEHLGFWDQGIHLLQQLRETPVFDSSSESHTALALSIASLELAGGKRQSVDDLAISHQVRVLAVAALALSAQKKPEKAEALFRAALAQGQLGIDRIDPAHRVLAVTGNNLACALEEKVSRTKSETDLMILAAQTGRKYWEIAGSWLEVERAEYRLSQTYLKANDFAKALEHAQTCLQVAHENNAPSLEIFFGYEALAIVEKARGNLIGFSKAVEQLRAYFVKLNPDDKSWCEASLNKFTLMGLK